MRANRRESLKNRGELSLMSTISTLTWTMVKYLTGRICTARRITQTSRLAHNESLSTTSAVVSKPVFPSMLNRCWCWERAEEKENSNWARSNCDRDDVKPASTRMFPRGVPRSLSSRSEYRSGWGPRATAAPTRRMAAERTKLRRVMSTGGATAVTGDVTMSRDQQTRSVSIGL